jgi:phosphatidylserine decarboxylase
MAKPLPLPVWDRRAGKLIEDWMDDGQPHYESDPQRSLTQLVKSHPLYDKLYAIYENSRWSAREIEPFIRRHLIDMSDFERVKYRSFAEFFDRRFRLGARQFPSSLHEMGAFAEARYFGWRRLAPDQTLPVKGYSLNAGQILGGRRACAAVCRWAGSARAALPGRLPSGALSGLWADIGALPIWQSSLDGELARAAEQA